MTTQSHLEEESKDDGTTAQKLVVEFSNGSLQQLNDLGSFFGVKDADPSEVVKLAISFLQNLKDRSDPGKATTKD